MIDGYGYIYETTNLLNDRKYVGQKKGLFNRSYLGSGFLLKRAVDKYGKSSFEVKVIAMADDKAKLDELERSYIAEYRRIFGDTLYNMADGGTGGDTWSGHPREEKLKSMLSRYWVGKKHSVESKEKLKDLMWMNNPATKACSRIRPVDVQNRLREGWIEGRTHFNPVTNKGSKRIYNKLTKEEKFVAVDDIGQHTADGWTLGRMPGYKRKAHKDGCQCLPCKTKRGDPHKDNCNCYGCQRHDGSHNGRYKGKV